MSVYFADDAVTIHHGNALALPLEDASVDLVVTSPPYFGLRSYQDGGEHYSGQIGSEATPAEFVDALIAATAEMVRVLKPSGSIWVNLGDRFSDGLHLDRQGMTIEDAAWLAGVIDSDGSISVHVNKQPEGRAPSFVPWVRVGQMRPEVVQQIAAVTGIGKAWQDGRGVWNWSAAAQQAATVLRWIWPWLRIKQRQGLAAVELARHIAEKRNRGTWSRVADEDVAYRQSIRDAVLDWNGGRRNDFDPPRLPYPNLPQRRTWVPAKSLVGVPWRYALRCIDDLGLILRAEVIWSKPNGLPESVTDRVRRSHETWFHFTVRPRYFSAVDEVREPLTDTSAHAMSRRDRTDKRLQAADAGMVSAANPLGKLPGSVWGIPTQPLRVPDHLGIDHFAAFPMEWPRRIIRGWSPEGGTVLDPFGGTGTTALVARSLGRKAVHVDLSADYCRLAQWRVTDPAQLERAQRAPKPRNRPCPDCAARKAADKAAKAAAHADVIAAELEAATPSRDDDPADLLALLLAEQRAARCDNCTRNEAPA